MNPLRCWNGFWFGPTSARPLGTFRVAFGLATLLHLFFIGIDLDHWLTDAGLVRGSEAREVAGPWRPSPLQWVQDPNSVHIFFGAVVAVTVLFTLGWRTRVMSVLLYLGLLSIHHRNLGSVSGADVLIVILAFYLMFSPCGAAYSLDARRAFKRRGGTEAEPLIVPWAQRLIQIQIAMIYFITATWKANGASWIDGTALHYILNNGEIRRYTLGLTESPVAMNALAHATILVEFALAFLLWVRKARPFVILAGLGLHVGILLTVNIPIFGELMVISYLTFLGPEEFNTLRKVMNPRKWRRAAAEQVPEIDQGRDQDQDQGSPAKVRIDGATTRLNGPHGPAEAEMEFEVVSETEPTRR